MDKKLRQPIVYSTVAAIIMLTSSISYAQQMEERDVFAFKVLGSNAALNKAIAIEQVEDGFGTSTHITSTNTTNESTSVGTLAEVTAILQGDNSALTLTSNPVQDATNSTMTSNSNQTATNNLTVDR